MEINNLEGILQNLIKEAIPRVHNCIFQEQRAQMRRDALLAKLLELYKSNLPQPSGE